jgi:hypothetical protein
MILYIRDRSSADDAWMVGALSELWGSPFVISRALLNPGEYLRNVGHEDQNTAEMSEVPSLVSAF